MYYSRYVRLCQAEHFDLSNWENVQVGDVNFPSYQVNLNSTFTLEELNEIDININKTTCYISHIRKIDDSLPRNQLPYFDHKYLIKNREWVINSRHKVFLEIINIIKQLTDNSHNVAISDYSRWLHSVCMEQAPCPYCFALSLWFFNANYYPYPWFARHDDREDKLLMEHGYVNSISPLPKILLTSSKESRQDGCYIVSKKFQKWSYLRSLKASFVSLLKASFNIVDDWEQYQLIGMNFFRHSHEPDLSIGLNNQQYFYIEGRQLKLWYVEGDPFDGLTSINREFSREHCLGHQKHVGELCGRSHSFHKIITDNPISFKEYRDLERENLKFISTRWL